jgi:hypothetical protein
LSEFDSVDHVIRRAASRTWGSITEFFRAFHVDAEQHDLSIMAPINMSESLYWELMPLQGIEHWRSYIKTTCEIGLPVMLFIQVIHKDGSSSQVPESDPHQGEAELQAEMVLQLSHKKKEITAGMDKDLSSKIYYITLCNFWHSI